VTRKTVSVEVETALIYIHIYTQTNFYAHVNI